MPGLPDGGAGYVGWVRVASRGRKWGEAVEAATAGECWRLLVRVRLPAQAVEKTVLRKGERP